MSSTQKIIKPFSRLGTCLVCKENEAKYTCPECQIVTCSLPCVKNHKKEFQCDGVRKKTEFVPIKKMNEFHLLSDYRLLEELSRVNDACTRDSSRKITRKSAPLSLHLQRIRKAVAQRRSKIYYLPKNFSKHKDNTTFLDWKTKRLNWKLKVIFLHAQKYMITVDRCPEDTLVQILIDKCLKASIERKKEFRPHFEAYQQAMSDILVLMQAEKLPEARSKFFVFDMNKSLKENLIGKRIVEYPTLYVAVNGFFAAGKCEGINSASTASKSKLSSLLFSSYSLQSNDKNNDSSDDEKDECKQKSISEQDDSMDEAFDLLDARSYKDMLSSLYKEPTPNT